MSAGTGFGYGRQRRRVRPYTVTMGRTAPDDPADLEIEALVEATPQGRRALPELRLEWRAIIILCREPVSIAEISARLDVPLGVGRVLVADMAAEGLVQVHRPAGAGEQPDLALLDRVLQGLHTL